MKVVQIIPKFGMGGAEIMCENLVYALQEQGVDVSVISLYNFQSPITERLEKKNIKIIYLDKKSGLDFFMIKKLTKVFKEEKPDVIHCHLATQIYSVPAAIMGGVKGRVYTVHNIADEDASFKLRVLNNIFFRINKLKPVSLSPQIQESVERVYRIKKKKIPVIFNGIDLSKCNIKRNYSSEGIVKILHIGRFSEQKNHVGLIEGFALFHKNCPNSRLQLIGDGEKRQEIENLVKIKGLTDSVQFLGIQDNVYEYLHNADLFTLPSLYEGLPITLIEAMGTGLPIVATNVGGVPDMLVNGESAILTAVDKEEVAKAFTRLAENEELRKKLGENAQKESVKFSSAIMAKKYMEVYRS